MLTDGRVDLMPAVQLYWVVFTSLQLFEQRTPLAAWVPFGLYGLIKPLSLFYLWGTAGGFALRILKRRLPVLVESHYAYPH